MTRLNVSFTWEDERGWPERIRGIRNGTLHAFSSLVSIVESALNSMNLDLKVEVQFMPDSDLHYSPSPGKQILGLREMATPQEAALFLTHTLFHEITETTDTPKCKRAVDAPRDASEWKEGLLVLARNEGFANYAFDSAVRELHGKGHSLVYFHDVPYRSEPRSALKSLALLNLVTEQRWSQNPAERARSGGLLKSESFPALNILGFHFASVIETRWGESRRLELQRLEIEDWLDAYVRASGPFADLAAQTLGRAKG